MIRLTYDVSVDALAIQLHTAKKGTRVVTRQVAPGVHLDFDSDGHVLALEVLDASVHIPREDLEVLPTGARYVTVAEAAKESGLSTETLRGQINKGRIPAVKRGRDWLIGATELLNYLESRESRGRPAANPRARTGKRVAKAKAARKAA